MADIICRWRNATPKTVMDLVAVLPKENIPSDQFRERMENQDLFPDFFRTAYQLACQLALYCEIDGCYIPRFHNSITESEAEEYLSHWIRWYYAPNPFTKSLKQTTEPCYLVKTIFDHVSSNGPTNIKDLLESIFKDPMGNLDIVINAINNYSKILKVEDKIITLTHNYADFIMDMPGRDDKKSFFENFSRETSSSSPLDEPLQLIYYGAPGTGKSFTIDDKTDEANSVRTTFHPDSDYASFVGAYKPTMEDVPMSAFVGKEVHLAQPQGDHTGKERKIVYKYVPQAFLKAYVEAWKDRDNPHFLIIEEINRGNCAQIFGDLFQLLDRNNSGSSSYAIHADDDIMRFLSTDEKGFAALTDEQKEAITSFVLVKDNGKAQAIGHDILDGKLLLLPPNLYIWATMNTSDQSLFPIDSAFKRRWNWKYIPIEYAPSDKRTGTPVDWKMEVAGNRYYWGDFLSKINPEIYTLTESSDKQMGYFFAKADPKTGIISEDVFLNKVLFYLWTDVFKDYDVSSAYFHNKKAGCPFRFTDFFEDSEALGNFIANFGLTPVFDAEPIDEDDPAAGSIYESIRVKVNGNEETSMTRSMIAILSEAARTHTISDIEDAVRECVTRGSDPIVKRVDNPETYTKENRWNPTVIRSTDGVSFVVTSMWQRQFLPMIEKLAQHFGVSFEVVNP